MKIFTHVTTVIVLIAVVVLGFTGPTVVFAATTPSLGIAASFGVLSSTYTNTAAGTTISGDLGYTTGPAMAPSVTGVTHVANATYNQAGTDQATALNNLNNQACTFTFAPGAIDLATDTTHGPIGVYTPGVYCTSGAASIGTGGITLSGSGTYIFKVSGALTSVANSGMTLTNGASSCDVFWAPTAATTLGANSTFIGTIIDAAGITIGSTVTWSGRALAFGGTVSTTSDAITVSTCVAPTATPTPTPTPTPSPTATPTPSLTPSPTPTSSPTPSAAPTLTPLPTSSPVATLTPTPVPGLPSAGIAPDEKDTPWSVLLMGILILVSTATVVAIRKQKV